MSLNVIEKKIKTLSELSRTAAKLKKEGKKIAHCHGVFDLIHPGHIRHLAEAKGFGDVLVVTLTKDRFVKRGPGRPIFNEHLRAETLASLAVTDFVCALDHPTAVEAIRAIAPDFYVKGQDYEKRSQDVTGKIHDEEKAVRDGGGKIVFTHDITFSSSALINRHLEVYPPETAKYLKKMAAKHRPAELQDRLGAVKKLRILVIGDAIIDRYAYCRPMNKSTKEPIVANQFLSREDFAGGVLATANHTAQLVRKLDLVTVLGKKDAFEPFVRSKLDPRIRPRIFHRSETPTTLKERFLSEETKQKFFEVCYLDDRPLHATEEKSVVSYLDENIGRFDLVIVNDFGHGLLTPRIIRSLCRGAKFLALNVQTNSANLGFNLVTKYGRADFVCIDELELRLASHSRTAPIQDLVKNLSRKLSAKHVAVTRGKDGAVAYTAKEGFESAPAFSYHVVDKVGAGDAFFAYTAPCFAAGLPQDLAVFIGNAVGSLAVQIVGNREPVRYADLMKFLERLLKF